MNQPDNRHQKEIEKAIEAVLDEEKKRQRNYSDSESIDKVQEHLTEQFTARVGLGLSEVRKPPVTADAGAGMADTIRWAAEQYFLGQLKKLRDSS
jgi:hypothetical protein